MVYKYIYYKKTINPPKSCIGLMYGNQNNCPSNLSTYSKVNFKQHREDGVKWKNSHKLLYKPYTLVLYEAKSDSQQCIKFYFLTQKSKT